MVTFMGLIPQVGRLYGHLHEGVVGVIVVTDYSM